MTPPEIAEAEPEALEDLPGLADPEEVYTASFFEASHPPPDLTVSEWADEHRFLANEESAKPGKWRTDFTPYLREIMDHLSASSPTTEVVVQKGAQVGGTEVGNNFLGYLITNAPGPAMAVQPTEGMAKRMSRQRLRPMIENSPVLRQCIAPMRSRDGGNTAVSKEFRGGILTLAWSNSASGLRSMPVRYLFMDEVDGYPQDADGEGEPTQLARARTRSYGRKKKILVVSTPTFEGRSRVEAARLRGDDRRLYVPCPHCGHMDYIRWERIRWPKGSPEQAALVCTQCGAETEETYKAWLLANGEWRAHNDDPEPGVVSYLLPSLYSPPGNYSWADAARDWEAAQDNPLQLREFINLTLGETFRDKGEAPDWNRLYERRENYVIGVVPFGGYVLTAAADVQHDRIEAEIVAWGPGLESWSVEHLVFPGDPANIEDPCWENLEELLSRQWQHESGGAIGLRAMAVDGSYLTPIVDRWVRRQHQPHRVFAIQGRPNLPRPIGQPQKQEVTTKGKSKRHGAKLWPVGTDVLKSELYGWLRLNAPTEEDEPYPPGYCHFPQYDQEYFKQITAEELQITHTKTGHRKYQWEKVRDRNEILDLRVYNRAMTALVGLDRWTEEQWEAEFRDARLTQPAGKVQSEDSKRVNKANAPRRKRSSFWNK
ncbi:MAG: phage terminase large subunit family protein [Thiohalorhabdus sp.]